jgi:hypothetical protein
MTMNGLALGMVVLGAVVVGAGVTGATVTATSVTGGDSIGTLFTGIPLIVPGVVSTSCVGMFGGVVAKTMFVHDTGGATAGASIRISEPKGEGVASYASAEARALGVSVGKSNCLFEGTDKNGFVHDIAEETTGEAAGETDGEEPRGEGVAACTSAESGAPAANKLKTFRSSSC